MIITKRLTIKPIELKDQDAMISLFLNEQIKETYMIPDLTYEEASAFFHKLQIISQSNERYQLGIYLQDQLIGFLNDTAIEDDTIELGYMIHPDHQKKGYASEALQAIILHLFQNGFHKIIAGAFMENIASQKVMITCGMKKTNKQDRITYHGHEHVCVYYEIDAKDFS